VQGSSGEKIGYTACAVKVGGGCGTRIHGLKIQRQRILTEQDIARLLHGTLRWSRTSFNLLRVLIVALTLHTKITIG